MYDPQIGDKFTNKGGRVVRIVQSDPLNNRVQIEYEESLRHRWIDLPDLLAKYTYVV